MSAVTTPKSFFPSIVETSIDFVTVQGEVLKAVSGGSSGGTQVLATERIALRTTDLICAGLGLANFGNGCYFGISNEYSNFLTGLKRIGSFRAGLADSTTVVCHCHNLQDPGEFGSMNAQLEFPVSDRSKPTEWQL
jgi:hypothetical protein